MTKPLAVDELETRLAATQAALEKSEARYKNRFDHSPVGVYRSTLAGTFVELNSAMARMMGYDTEQEALRDLTDLSRQLYVDPNAAGNSSPSCARKAWPDTLNSRAGRKTAKSSGSTRMRV